MTNKADRPFSEVAAAPENANWEKLIARPSALYNSKKSFCTRLRKDTSFHSVQTVEA